MAGSSSSNSSSSSLPSWTSSENAALKLVEHQIQTNPFFQNRPSNSILVDQLRHYVQLERDDQLRRRLKELNEHLLGEELVEISPLGLKLEKPYELAGLVERKLNPVRDHHLLQTGAGTQKNPLIVDNDHGSYQKLTGSLQSKLNPDDQHPQTTTRKKRKSIFDYELPKTSEFRSLAESRLNLDQRWNTPSKRTRRIDYASLPPPVPPLASDDEKFKSSTTPATVLRIGSWKKLAMKANEILAKCYFAQKKLVWEMLEDGIKKKIEIPWEYIIAIKDSCLVHFDIELKEVPLFFEESNPEPGKHILWKRTTDFTGGQASKCRRHKITFRPGLLQKLFLQLLQSDRRLEMISTKPFPSMDNPHFPHYSALVTTPVLPPLDRTQNPLQQSIQPEQNKLPENDDFNRMLMDFDYSSAAEAIANPLLVSPPAANNQHYSYLLQTSDQPSNPFGNFNDGGDLNQVVYGSQSGNYQQQQQENVVLPDPTANNQQYSYLLQTSDQPSNAFRNFNQVAYGSLSGNYQQQQQQNVVLPDPTANNQHYSYPQQTSDQPSNVFGNFNQVGYGSLSGNYQQQQQQNVVLPDPAANNQQYSYLLQTSDQPSNAFGNLNQVVYGSQSGNHQQQQQQQQQNVVLPDPNANNQHYSYLLQTSDQPSNAFGNLNQVVYGSQSGNHQQQNVVLADPTANNQHYSYLQQTSDQPSNAFRNFNDLGDLNQVVYGAASGNYQLDNNQQQQQQQQQQQKQQNVVLPDPPTGMDQHQHQQVPASIPEDEINPLLIFDPEVMAGFDPDDVFGRVQQ